MKQKDGKADSGKKKEKGKERGKWGGYLLHGVDLESWVNVVTIGSLFLGQETEIVLKIST